MDPWGSPFVDQDGITVVDFRMWDPPVWWSVDGNLKDSERIKTAYLKAETCTLCRNSILQTLGAEFRRSEIQASAQNGCAGCMIVCGTLKSIASLSGRPIAIHTTIRWRNGLLRWVIYQDWSSWEVFTRKDPLKNNTMAAQRLLNAAQSRPWLVPRLPHELEVSLNTGSEHAIKRALAWIDDCENNHEACRAAIPTLPTRVLLIEGLRNVRLYDSKGELERYVCLSHCWGAGSVMKTTSSTLKEYKQGLPWEELPQTFQDAIHFTSQLGLRYLWIDSLCILQDSDEDWRHEGSSMSQIYSGAHVTLAATAASCAYVGLFRKTPERTFTTHSYPDVDGSNLEVYVRSEVDHWAYERGYSPLHCRGWALQECLLSRRLIQFTHWELIWGCRIETTCECSLMDDSNLRQKMRNPKDFADVFSTCAALKPEFWHKLVERYTNLNLTFEKDGFPALQGIGKQMYQHKKSKYLAGLWESSLACDLLWHMKYEDRVTRPQEWRAPSWSWASVIGRVVFCGGECTPRATYVTSDIKPAGTDEFGGLRSARITLSCRCFQEDAEGVYRHSTQPNDNIRYPDQSVFKGSFEWLREDCPVTSRDGERPHSTPMIPGQIVKTLLVGDEAKSHCTVFYFLVLRSIDAEEKTYERIGLLCVSSIERYTVSDFALGEEEIIHIV